MLGKEDKAKRVIEEAWLGGQGDVLKGVDRVRVSLGSWQYSRYNYRKGRIESLLKEIESVMDIHGNEPNTDILRTACEELGCLYNFEEVY